MRPSLKCAKPAPACRTPVRRGSPTSCRGIPLRDVETDRAPALSMTHAWRVAAATHRARTPSQPARHTRRRQAQLIGCLRPWDGYPAVPSPPRLPPDGASTSLPVYQSHRRTARYEIAQAKHVPGAHDMCHAPVAHEIVARRSVHTDQACVGYAAGAGDWAGARAQVRFSVRPFCNSLRNRPCSWPYPTSRL